jgi:dihydropyrimidinase
MGSNLIKNGEIVTALDRTRADILVEGGKIAQIAPSLSKLNSDTEIIDAAGLLVFPGAVDAHVHMELPFMGTVSADDFETGTAAGVVGGTTTIIDFVIPSRGESLLGALRAWRDKASKAVSDYAFHMAVTGWNEKTAAEMAQCVEKEGIPSFKIFMAYKGAIGVDDGELVKIMETARKIGAIITAHCENGDLVLQLQEKYFNEGKVGPAFHALSRPPRVEGEATHRVLTLADFIGVPIYIVHVTCKEALEAISQARSRGQTVFGETCTQYLLLDDDVYQKPGFEGAAYVMSPPIRSRGHQDALWAALKSGVIQTVATDHCPFNQETQKIAGQNDFRKIPNGAAGIEHRLALMYTYGVLAQKIDIHQFVNLNCTQPAKLFGMYPRKGSVTVGADADLVLWDPATENVISAKTHRHRVDRSIFEGFKTIGAPQKVIVDGRIQYDDGNLKVERGAGRYISRALAW